MVERKVRKKACETMRKISNKMERKVLAHTLFLSFGK